MRIVSNKKCDTNQNTSVNLYKSLIALSLKARETELKKLVGARLSLGAFKSSPTIKRLNLTGLTALYIRRDYLVALTSINLPCFDDTSETNCGYTSKENTEFLNISQPDKPTVASNFATYPV